ncbi:hypothetical protein BSKO_00643 [Bryopsis sp. KO-2023]|nr:hypothetical protein BSKO_00643 [Bryopsis sp. KO-2023]
MPSRKAKRANRKRGAKSVTPDDANGAPEGRRTSTVSVEEPMLTTPKPDSHLCTPPPAGTKIRSAGSKGGKSRRMQASVERASEASGLRRSRRTFSRLANARMQGQAGAVDLFATRERLVEVVKEVLDITDVSSDDFMGVAVKNEAVEVEANGTGYDTTEEEPSTVESSDSDGVTDVDESDRMTAARDKTHAQTNRAKTKKRIEKKPAPVSRPYVTPVREEDATRAVEELDGFLESVEYFGAATPAEPDIQTRNGAEAVQDAGPRAQEENGIDKSASGDSDDSTPPCRDPRKRKTLWGGFYTQGVVLRKRMNIVNDRAYNFDEEMEDDEPFLTSPLTMGPLPAPHAESPAKLKRPFPESTESVRVSQPSSEIAPDAGGGSSTKRQKVQAGCSDGVVEAGQQAENGSLPESPERPGVSPEAGEKSCIDRVKIPLQTAGSIPIDLFPILPLRPIVCTSLERHVRYPAFIPCSELLAIELPRPELAGLDPVLKKIEPIAESRPIEILSFSELMERFAPSSADAERISHPPKRIGAVGDSPRDTPFSPIRNLVGTSHVPSDGGASIPGRISAASAPACPSTDDEFPGFGTPQNAVQGMEGDRTSPQPSEREAIHDRPFAYQPLIRFGQLKDDVDGGGDATPADGVEGVPISCKRKIKREMARRLTRSKAKKMQLIEAPRPNKGSQLGAVAQR